MSIELDAAAPAQGRVTGVIIPPPDIRAIIDKTATFVAKNGASFEQKILNSEEGKTAKFNFMRLHDPYHAYYEYKIREVEEGRSATTAPVEKPKPVPSSHEAATMKNAVVMSVKASFTSPLARLTASKPTEAPPLFDFSLAHPSGLTALDMDVIRLTAQFTAVNGRDFLAGLAQREQRNPQFDFLKPTHVLFNYFTSLVDSYGKILNPSKEVKAKIDNHSHSSAALQSAVSRWDWNRMEEERKRLNEQQVDEEKVAFQSIDWFDFVVVETIDFAAEELLDGYVAPKQQAATAPTSTYNGTLPSRIPQPMAGTAPPPPPQMVATAPMPPPAPKIVADTDDVDMDADMDIDNDMDMEEDNDIKVVSNYVPRTAQTVASSTSMYMVDPISKKQIPAEKMEDHMRIQLMDPSWREHQKRFQEKQLETGYAAGSSIAESLKLFARKRNDIFGREVEGDKEDASMAEEEEAPTVQWDGHQSSINMTIQRKNEINARKPPSQPEPVAPAITVGPSLPSAAPVVPIPVIAPVPVVIPPPPPRLPSASDSTVPAAVSLPVPVTVPVPVSAIPAPFSYIPPPYLPAPSATSSAPPAHATDQDGSNDKDLIPEPTFAALYPNPIVLKVVVPVDSSAAAASWGLAGQTVTISINVMSTCKELKERLSQELGGMPVNKQQLKVISNASVIGTFLKDANSLAAMNIGDGAVLELSLRSRGGKR